MTNKVGYLRLTRINYRLYIDTKSYDDVVTIKYSDKDKSWVVNYGDVCVLKGCSFTFCRDKAKTAIARYLKRGDVS